MLKNITKKIISPIIFLTLGVLVTVIWLRRCEWLTWDELNLSNLISIISIFVNIILASIVVVVLQRIQDIRRVEKNILISRVEAEISRVKEFVEKCCTDERSDFSSITGFLKTLKIRLNKITDTHSNCESESKNLLESITTLNSLLTDPKGSNDLKIDRNKVSLKPRRIQEINIQMAEIENSTLDLIICINRHSSKS